MNEKQKNTYIAWLNDAHAMELGLVTVLEKQAADAGAAGKSAMAAQITKHLEETKRHADMVRGCVERNGGSTSTAKDFLSKVSATMNGLGMSMMEDLMVKNVHSAYAAEHFEIATYTTLIAAASALGDAETEKVCGEILEDELNMANWVSEQLPGAVQEHMESLA